MIYEDYRDSEVLRFDPLALEILAVVCHNSIGSLLQMGMVATL
jgi:hypothetical protein